MSKPTEVSTNAHAATASTKVVELILYDKPTEFRMSEQVFKPDSFVVTKMPEKVEVLTVKGKVTSFHGEKTMYDVNGSSIFKMTEQTNSTLQLQYLFDYRTKSVFTVRKKGFLPGRGRGTLYVWSGKGDEGEPMLEIISNGSRSEFTIVEKKSSKRLAKVQRSTFGVRRVLTGADYYKINVSAGAEVAFVMMLVVCSDEHYTDFNR